MLQEQISNIQQTVAAKGRSISDLCAEAGIARSTWDRWVREETTPNFSTLDKVREAANRLERVA